MFQVALQQLARHRGIEERLALGDRAHGADQILAGGLLEEIAGRAGLDRAKEVRVALVHGQDQYLRLGTLGADQAGSLQPVQVGHGDVQHGDVRAALAGQGDRLAAVRRLADHADVGRGRRGRQPLCQPAHVLGQQLELRFAPRLAASSAVNVRSWMCWKV